MLFKPGQGKALFPWAQQALTRTVLGKLRCAIALYIGHLITEDLNALTQIGEQESRQGRLTETLVSLLKTQIFLCQLRKPYRAFRLP